MARIHYNSHYNDTRGEVARFRDARQGALDDAFWPEDELVDYVPSSKAKKRYPRGCKGNDNKEHVYVWVPWSWGWGEPKYEEKRCAGCEKRCPSINSFRRIK